MEIADYTQKGTDEGSGKSKAKELSEKKPQNMAQMKKMANFFEKHEANVGQIKSQGGPQTDGQKGIMQAWELHGGDACRQWVKGELAKFHDAGMRTKKLLRTAGGASPNKGTGVFDISIMDANKSRIHR